jgi:hypothetical protein
MGGLVGRFMSSFRLLTAASRSGVPPRCVHAHAENRESRGRRGARIPWKEVVVSLPFSHANDIVFYAVWLQLYDGNVFSCSISGGADLTDDDSLIRLVRIDRLVGHAAGRSQRPALSFMPSAPASAQTDRWFRGETVASPRTVNASATKRPSFSAARIAEGLRSRRRLASVVVRNLVRLVWRRRWWVQQAAPR